MTQKFLGQTGITRPAAVRGPCHAAAGCTPYGGTGALQATEPALVRATRRAVNGATRS
jgi:hypothetical protein